MTADLAEPRVLIADDQSELVEALRLLLKAEGIAMESVSSPEAAVCALRERPFDLILMDLNYTADTTSGREGIDLLTRIQALDATLPVVVMTGWGSVDLAVQAMRFGVRDFVQKPWDNQALVSLLRGEIAEGRARRTRVVEEERELEEARRIQRKLLPAIVPDVAGFEIATSWQPAARVGGDWFDAVAFARTRVALSIADVIGRGIPAALLMSNLQAAVRAFATESAAPRDLCAQVNRILSGHIAEGRFISFFYCVADSNARTVTYTNAGHHSPLLVRADGSVLRLHAGGPVLGVLAGAPYVQDCVAIAPGDRLVLYTDGLTEARNRYDEPFGEERLAAVAVKHRACNAAGLQARLVDAAANFIGSTFQDDATLIVVAANA